jgi:hypothetical protein
LGIDDVAERLFFTVETTMLLSCAQQRAFAEDSFYS